MHRIVLVCFSILLLICCTLFPATLYAQDSLNVTRVGKAQFWGGYYDVASRDGYAYFATNFDGLRIVDVNQPTAMAEVGHVQTDEALAVVIHENLLYLADGRSGLRIFDLNDPVQPVELGTVSEGMWLNDLELSGNYVYAADEEASLRVIDVSDPAQPFVAATLETTYGAQLIKIDGEYAYLLTQDGYSPYMMEIIDISDPLQPVSVSANQSFFISKDYAVSDGILFIKHRDQKSVNVVDVSDPTAPALIGSWTEPGPGTIFDLVLRGGILYCSIEHRWATFGLLRIVDVRDPAAPVLQYTEPTPSSIGGLSVTDTHLIFRINATQVVAADLASWPQDGSIGLMNLMPGIRDVVVADDIAYCNLTYPGTGYVAIDVSNPAQPSVLWTWEEADDVQDRFAVADGYLYFEEEGHLEVLDLSGPDGPERLPSTGLVVSAGPFELNYPYLYTGHYIISLVEPGEPTNAGYMPYGGKDMAFEGNYLYTLMEDETLKIYNATTPSAPAFCSEITLADWHSAWACVTVMDGYAYCQLDNDAIYVVDVHDPFQPEIVDLIDTDHATAYDIESLDGYLYINGDDGTDEREGQINILDVHDPLNPFLAGYYNVTGRYETDGTIPLTLANDYVYAVASNSLHILDCDAALPVAETGRLALPAACSLSPAFPNPFNNATTVSVSLPNPQRLQVQVLNINGQLVRELVNDRYVAGTHRFTLDAGSLASGVYFIQANAGGQFAQTRKVVFLP